MEFLRKLFRQPQPEPAPVLDGTTTAPLSDQKIQAIIQNQNPHYETQQLIAASGQSVGKQREHNEDSLLAITSTISGNSSGIPFGLYIVAAGLSQQLGAGRRVWVVAACAVAVTHGRVSLVGSAYVFPPTSFPTQIVHMTRAPTGTVNPGQDITRRR